MKFKNILIIIIALLSFAVRGYNEELVSYWNFEEDGHIVKDLGPAGINGKIEGDVQRVEGLSGNALSFPGKMDSYVVFEDKEPLDFQEAFTLSAWVYRDNTGTRWDGILINGAHQSGYQLFYSEISQKLTLYIHTDEMPYHPVTGAHIPMYEWMHIAVTYDGQEVRIYQNGDLTAKQNCTGKLANFPDKFYLGSAVRPFNAFRGLIDEVKNFGRSLDEEEILSLYEESAPEDHAPTPEAAPAFKELEAVRANEGIRITFQETKDFAQQRSENEAKVWIYRNYHRRTDENPGVKGGKIVLEGELKPDDMGDYEYIDTHPVKEGYSYYYWVTPDNRNFRIFPAHVRIYHPEVWWNEDMIRNKTAELAELYPDLIEIQTIGKTVEGRKLDALLAGNQEKMIAFIGAIHVSESGPELILGALKKLLEEEPELLNKVGIAAVPCVTLDERERKLATGYPRYLRKNAAGVDLNRNFPAHWEELPPPGTPQTDDPDTEIYRGPSPASEPETRAVMAFLEEINPRTSFFFHSLGSICSAGFVASQYAVSEDDEEYVELIEKICRIYAHGMYGDAYSDYYWIHFTSRQGSHNVWMHKNFNSPAVSLELDSYEKGQVVYHDGVTPELMEEYQLKHKNAMKAVINAILHDKIPRLEHNQDSSK